MRRLLSAAVVMAAMVTMNAPAFAAITAQKSQNGLQVQTPSGLLSVEPASDHIVHVRFANAIGWSNPYSSWVIPQPSSVKWTLDEGADFWLVKTGAVQVKVRKSDAALSFLDPTGAVLLAEGGSWSRHIPASGTGPVTQTFDTNTRLYGLGQHQNGMLDYAGSTVHLQQANRDVGVPMMVSPRGFGLLWNNASVTDVDVAQPISAALAIRSEAGQGIDYHFIYGPDLDEVVAGYRQLTGDAPLMPRWSWGLWQSKEHYATQAELLDVAARYRAMNAPIDVVVQDWQYWRPGQWGSHQFDAARFPDPKGMVSALHKQNVHVAISVWARFDLGTANLTELDNAGAVYPKVYRNVYPAGQGRWYDPFSRAGRDIYWSQVQRNLGTLGFDSWWLDASEAELGGQWGEMRDVQTAGGPGQDVFNAYPFMHTTAVYQGARRDMGGRRPLILTRSAFAGQQRNAAITWSGDTQGDWETFRRQIPAALNFTLSGIPYWSADIGGFFGGDPKNPDYAELFTRWYQFAVFNPMFRVHGTGEGKELWAFAPEVQKILLSFDQLRYRLLPYIYSASWDVTRHRGTMMRALAMDFREDEKALNIPDQFMFGRALLVSPIVQQGARIRSLYLPGGTDWYDFWTGARMVGGQVIAGQADLSRIPLHVRAGTILPLGPIKPYADAPSDDPLELRVYPGHDGSFELYDDEGDGFGYEQGRFATVSFRWNDATHRLDIGQRQGSFPGMKPSQQLSIRCGSHNAGQAVSVTYNGKAISVDLSECRAPAQG